MKMGHFWDRLYHSIINLKLQQFWSNHLLGNSIRKCVFRIAFKGHRPLILKLTTDFKFKLPFIQLASLSISLETTSFMQTFNCGSKIYYLLELVRYSHLYLQWPSTVVSNSHSSQYFHFVILYGWIKEGTPCVEW